MASVQPLKLPRTAIAPKFDNGEQWHHDLGDVPLSRIIFDPWPGTATEEDLLLFVERDKRLCELVDGTLVEKPVGMDEAMVGSIVHHLLTGFVLERNLGITIGEAGPSRMKWSNRIRMPDVAFFSNARLACLPDPRPKVWTLAPDLAVEVLSESNTPAEMAQKITEFFGSGTQLAWLIDPVSRTAAVYTSPDRPDQILGEAGTIDGGNVLPGFSCVVGKFFMTLDRLNQKS